MTIAINNIGAAASTEVYQAVDGAAAAPAAAATVGGGKMISGLSIDRTPSR